MSNEHKSLIISKIRNVMQGIVFEKAFRCVECSEISDLMIDLQNTITAFPLPQTAVKEPKPTVAF